MIEDELLQGAVPSASDLSDLLGLFTDPLVAKTLGGVRTEAEVRGTLERWKRIWAENNSGPLVFRLRDDAAFVGYAGLAPADRVEPGAVEVLYAVRPDFWGRGLATRMARFALATNDSRHDVGSIIGYTLVSNRASQRVLEKLGLVREREFEHADLPHILYRLPEER